MFGKTYTFTYDEGGNIIEKCQYDFTLTDNLEYNEHTTISYDYKTEGWKDQLVSVVKDGKIEEFKYDVLGNPETYRNNKLTWSHGRRLDKFGDIEYKYNTAGIRTSKKANGYTTRFYLNGNKIIRQQDAINTIDFIYGVDGLTGFTLNGNEYTYKKNVQNDIVGIYNSNGTEIVRYEYDAWGMQTLSYFVEDSRTYTQANPEEYNDSNNVNQFVALHNPFRYRGYYFDYETGLYYLNSRYYDPELGRFINADDISLLNELKEEINGLNLYVYCFNNPVNTFDDDGRLAWWAKLLIGLAIIAVLAVATIVTAGAAGIGVGAALASGFTGAALTTASGAVATGVAATLTSIAASAFAGAVIGAGVGFAGGFISGFLATGNISGALNSAADGFMWGAGSGALTGALGGVNFKYGNFGPNDIGNIFRVAGNVVVSTGTYFMKAFVNNETPSVFGFTASVLNGVFAGLLAKTPISNSLFESVGFEIIETIRVWLKTYNRSRFTDIFL